MGGVVADKPHNRRPLLNIFGDNSGGSKLGNLLHEIVFLCPLQLAGHLDASTSQNRAGSKTSRAEARLSLIKISSQFIREIGITRGRKRRWENALAIIENEDWLAAGVAYTNPPLAATASIPECRMVCALSVVVGIFVLSKLQIGVLLAVWAVNRKVHRRCRLGLTRRS